MFSDKGEILYTRPPKRTKALVLVILFILGGKKTFVINYSILLPTSHKKIFLAPQISCTFSFVLKIYTGKI